MITNEHIYVLDSNALSQIKREYRAGNYFRKNCRIPSEVLYEIQDFPDINELQQLEYRTTPSVLTLLAKVMSTVPVGDTRLVDLYSNLGNADPLIVAVALEGQSLADEMLFATAWTVVSDDKAVQAKARDFGLPVMINQDFLSVLMSAA